MDPRLKYKKIQPINYELLKEVRERTNHEMVMFDEKLSKQAACRQEMKDDQALRSHQQVWFEAARRVNECYAKLQSELTAIYNSEALAAADFENGKNFVQYMKGLDKINNEFYHNVLDPITTLRTDLKNWLKMRARGKQTTDPQPIKDLLRGMFTSIAAMEKDLASEEDALSIEDKNVFLRDQGICKRLTDQHRERYHMPIVGIPPEAWEWDAPNDEFRAKLLTEFIHLDAGFMDRINQLRAEMIDLDNRSVNKWPRKEVLKCEFIWEIFDSTGDARRKQKCLDFLCRQPERLKKTDYAQILDLLNEHNILRTRMGDLILCWTRSRQEMSDRIRLSLSDALVEAEKRDLQKCNAEKQRNLCLQLAAQVQQWRKEKAELAELEYRANQEFQAEKARLDAEKLDREMHRREVIKKLISDRRRAQQAERESLQAAERARMAELQAAHAAQRRLDTERLAELEKERLRRLAEGRARAREEAEREQSLKEARLEAIRMKVRPVVPDDPTRLLAYTAAWRHRIEQSHPLPEELEGIELRRFYLTIDNPLNTFTDKQLQNDRRTRLSAALFDAGLLDSDYARDLLAQVPLERPVRLEMMTSLEAEQRRMKKASKYAPR